VKQMPVGMRSATSRDVRWAVDEHLGALRASGALAERQWLDIMSRLHPEGFREGYEDALTPPRGGRQVALV